MGKQQLRFAIAALLVGVAWGYLRHRRHPRRQVLALVQGLEWFVAYGGAAALLDTARSALETEPEPPVEFERITHIRQVIEERTGTEG
ncbi:MAG: hypothetical protein GEU80_07015 [Dehalococcoidia bacterium]|nr:hypothetical protein [Dehalococcoidia bacterium]